MRVNFKAVDGFKLLGGEVGAWMMANVVETLGVDESVELNTAANATSIPNEADATTGYTQVGLDAGANVFQSQSGTVDDGTYALEADANDTPTANARFHTDLDAAPFNLVSGNYYTLQFRARHVGTGGIWNVLLADTTGLNVFVTNVAVLNNADTAFATYSVTFKHGTKTRYLGGIEFSGTNDGGVFLDAVTVKRSGDLVSNGSMHTETAGVHWSLGANWAIAGGVLAHTAGSAANSAQNIPFVEGLSYVVTYDVSGRTVGTVQVELAGPPQVDGASRSANGTYTETLVASAGSSALSFTPSTDFDGDIDNVTLRLAIPDHSPQADGLEVHGEIDKTLVLSSENVTTVGYGGYSGDDFSRQPYNANMDFGTDNWCLLGWFKITGDGIIFHRGYWTGSAWSGAQIQLRINSGTLNCTVTDDAYVTFDSIATIDTYTDGVWYFASVVRSGTNIFLYVNGVLVASGALVNAVATLSNSNATLMFGDRQNHDNPATTADLSGWKAFGAALTQTQIQTVYDSERILFEKDGVFSIVGNNYDLEQDLSDGTRGIDTNKDENFAEGGFRETVVHFKKKTWNCPVQPFDDVQFKFIRKFLEACEEGQAFTFDERGTIASPDDLKTVYLTSQNHQYPRENNSDWRSTSFTLRAK